MKLILFLLIVVLVFIETVFGWKAILDRFDLKYVNEKRLKILSAKIFKFNRTTKAVTVELDIFYDLHPELMIEIKMNGMMSNEYRPLPLVITRKICDFLQLEYQWLKDSMNCNFNDKCPVPKGRYYLRDYSIDVSRFPKKPWSIDNYKLQVRIYYRKEEEIVLDLYIITTDNDEYVV